MTTSSLSTPMAEDDPAHQAQQYVEAVFSQETLHFEFGGEWIEFNTESLMTVLNDSQEALLRQLASTSFLTENEDELRALEGQAELILRDAVRADRTLAPGWSLPNQPVSSDQGHAVL